VLDCDVCGAKVTELRRGRCWGCYTRWADARPVGIGARCLACNDRRRRVLRSVELLGAWHPMCFNCHGQALALDPMPPTIAELKVTLERERRAKDRRIGKPDSRVFVYERRVGERRAGRGDDGVPIDEEMIVEITIEQDPSEVGADLTQIRERFAL